MQTVVISSFYLDKNVVRHDNNVFEERGKFGRNISGETRRDRLRVRNLALLKLVPQLVEVVGEELSRHHFAVQSDPLSNLHSVMICYGL